METRGSIGVICKKLGYILGVLWGLHRANGKENGNYYNILGYILNY